MADTLYKYSTELYSPEKGGVFAAFPFDCKTEFGTRAAIRVICTIDGYSKKCSLIPMGDGTHAIHVRKEIRQLIGKEEGDSVEITIIRDWSPRFIEIPEDLQWLLDDDPHLRKKFEKLSFSIREAIVKHIYEAKSEETRARRIEKMIDRITKGFQNY